MSWDDSTPPVNWDVLEEELDRGKGFLTARDKEWLIEGIPEGTPANNARQYRSTVRRRTKNAIQDFRILQRHLDRSELDLIFDELENFGERFRKSLLTPNPEMSLEEAGIDYGTWAFYQGTSATMAILYEGLGREGFRERAEQAIWDVESGGRTVAVSWEDFQTATPSADLDIQLPEMVDLEDLADKYDAGAPVSFTNAEFGVIIELLQGTDADMPASREEFVDLYVQHVAEKNPDLTDEELETVRESMDSVGWPVYEGVDDLDEAKPPSKATLQALFDAAHENNPSEEEFAEAIRILSGEDSA